MYCTQCGEKAGENDRFCAACGSKLVNGEVKGAKDRGENDQAGGEQKAGASDWEEGASAASPGGTDTAGRYYKEMPDSEYVHAGTNAAAGESVGGNETLRALIGSNAGYYIRRWNSERTGSDGGWNWAAFFFNMFWCFYRKMYGIGFILITITLLAGYGAMKAEIPGLSTLIGLLIALYTGLRGNAHYYNRIRRKLAESETASGANEEELRRQGGTTWGGAMLSLAVFIGLAFAVAFVDDSLASSRPASAGSAPAWTRSTSDSVHVGNAVTSYDWEDKLGPDRMLMIIGGILSEWRRLNVPYQQTGAGEKADARIWAEMAMMALDSREMRGKTLNQVLEELRLNLDDALAEDSKWTAAKSAVSPKPTAAPQGKPAAQDEDVSSQAAASPVPAAAGYNEAKSKELPDSVHDAALVQKLLKEGADPDARTDYGAPALHRAAAEGYMEAFDALLAGKADPASKNDTGENALIAALDDTTNWLMGEYTANKKAETAVAMVTRLLELGLEPDSKTADGQTALMRAGGAFPKAVPVLLKAGADPNAADREGNVALTYALADETAIKQLLQAGANPKIRNKRGETVYDIVEKRNLPVPAKALGMELKLKPIFPENDDVKRVMDVAAIGLSQFFAENMFGRATIEGTDVWVYNKGAAEGYAFTSSHIEEVDIEGLQAGSLKMQMFIKWKEAEEEAESISVFVKNEDGVYGYHFKPGATVVNGQKVEDY